MFLVALSQPRGQEQERLRPGATLGACAQGCVVGEHVGLQMAQLQSCEPGPRRNRDGQSSSEYATCIIRSP